MSNKLVKKEKEVKETVREVIKFNVKDLLILIAIIVAATLRVLYIDNNFGLALTKPVNTAIIVASVIGFVAIAIICGSYQSKVQGDNITVASVLNDKNKPYYTPGEKALKFVNGFMRTMIIIIAGILPNVTISLILLVLSLIMIIIVTPKHKFKLMDIAYTAYTIGMSGMIFSSLNI